MTWHTALHMKSKTLRDGSESPIKNVQIAAKQTEKNKSSLRTGRRQKVLHSETLKSNRMTLLSVIIIRDGL